MRIPRLSEILGQDHALATLREAIRSGRIHHGWVFQGPVGVGKFSAAAAFAAVILDPTSSPTLGGEIEPDPGSATQALLRAGTHPDFRIVNKELGAVSRDPRVRDQKQSNIALEVLREHLLEPAALTRGVAGSSLAGKVFIVDEAELIDEHGQNAMLKTMEEPAPGTVLILVTSRPERLLPTIRSRCQRVAFAALDRAAMSVWLDRRDPPPTPEQREWALHSAGGSPGFAALGLDTGLFEWHRALSPMLAELERGRPPLDMAPTMAKLVDKWAEAAVEGKSNASKDAANKAGIRHMQRVIAEHLRQTLVRGAADAAAADRVARAIELLPLAESQFESNVPPMFVLENWAAGAGAAFAGDAATR